MFAGRSAGRLRFAPLADVFEGVGDGTERDVDSLDMAAEVVAAVVVRAERGEAGAERRWRLCVERLVKGSHDRSD
jgi:hypothetical protein